MHHLLRFYGTNQELAVRLYMLGGKLTRLPLAGSLLRMMLDRYAMTLHAAWVLTPEEAKKLIGRASKIAVGDCVCRKVFKNCDRPVRTDIVFGTGFDIFTEIRKREYVEISKEEAAKIIDECGSKGLIQTLLKCRHEVYAICNCCTCCCVPLRLKKEYGIRKVLIRDRNILDKS